MLSRSNLFMVRSRKLTSHVGVILSLLIISVGIIGCPWLNDDDKKTSPTEPTNSVTPTPGYELQNFQAIRQESRDWCAWIMNQAQVYVNVPRADDYLVTLTTQQTILHLVARVYMDGVLNISLHPDDRIVKATVQAGLIHAPGVANPTPVQESDYQFPQIWPAPPYATLFAWPAHGGIGTWDQIFTPDPQSQVLTLAEIKNGRLDLWSCAEWFQPTPTPTSTAAPVIRPTIAPTATPSCHGIMLDGACWYLSVLGAACEATCQAQGLTVDATIDAGGNFWDGHDAIYCRNLLILLHHPNIGLSTVNLTLHSGYGLCGANNTGVVIKRDGGPQDATHAFNNGQVACPCQ